VPSDQTATDTERRAIEGVAPFFSGAHWARLLLMALLTFSGITTIGQSIWQLAQTTEQIPGRLVEVSETRGSSWSANYHLVLRDGKEELHFVRLRNNGRLLNYLSTQGVVLAERAVVEVSDGHAKSLQLTDRENVVIRESGASPLVQLFIGVLLLVILALHLQPR
jgi:hypothetical protein